MSLLTRLEIASEAAVGWEYGGALPRPRTLHGNALGIEPRPLRHVFTAPRTRGVSTIFRTSSTRRTRSAIQGTTSSTAPSSRSVVIAVDTSPEAQTACQWAIDELLRPGDVAHLAHCIPPFPTSQGLYSLPDGRVAVVDFHKLLSNESEYLHAAEGVVADWAWRMFNHTGIHYVIDLLKEDETLSGDKADIARKLCAKARDLDAAALVISPHGRGGLGELIMGSVAADCARMSHVPVAILHPAPGDEEKKASIDEDFTSSVRWIGNFLMRHLGHPTTTGTAAETIAEIAASGPLHLGEAKLRPKPKSSVQDNELVSSGDFPEKEGDVEQNLIGQTVGEVPETELSLPGVEKATPTEPVGGNKKKVQKRTIVVAVDDSDASERACAWAAAHMCRGGDVLHLLHVIPALPTVAYGAGPMSGLTGSFMYVLDPPTKAFKQASEAYMEKRFHKNLREKGVQFESDIALELVDGSAGAIGKALLEKAESLNATAIVVGSHSRGGLPALLLGSVADWLWHRSANIPVVVLH